MTRIILFDNLKGIAFILMVIQHIFFFYDLSNNFTTALSKNILVNDCGIIARTLFIVLAGISVYLNNKNKNKSIKKTVSRSLQIGLHALLITIITYIYYPNLYVRFGILHFLAISTLLCSFISSYSIITILFFIFLLIFKVCSINPFIDTITGAKVLYNMIDYFPMSKWLPLLIFGIIIAQNINLYDLKYLDNKSILTRNNILTTLGKNSLELYTFHIILLILVYSLKK